MLGRLSEGAWEIIWSCSGETLHSGDVGEMFRRRAGGHFGYAWSLEGNTQEVLRRYFMEVCANHREELTWDLGLTGDKMDTNLL